MKVKLTATALLASLSLPSLASASDGVATSYNLFHRISSFDSTPDWTLRGTFDLGAQATSNATTTTAAHVVSNILTPEQVADLKQQAYAEDASELWYQVAIAPSHNRDNSIVQLQTSIRLCHLRQSHPDLPSLDDELIVNTRTRPSSSQVTGLTYRILDIVLDASNCPLRSTAKLEQVKESQRKQRQRQLATRSARMSKTKPPPPPIPVFGFNTRLEVKGAVSKAPEVTLVRALPTNEDGSVKQPEPEKSFLQKYWYYLIPIAIMLLIPPGEDEKSPSSTTTPTANAQRQAPK